MSNQAEQNQYMPRSGAKQVTFQSGKSILKLNFHVDSAIEWLTKNRNARGYITLGISERRSPSALGDTHCVWLDTWQPNQQQGNQPQLRQEQTRQQRRVEPNEFVPTPPGQRPIPVEEDSGVPF